MSRFNYQDHLKTIQEHSQPVEVRFFDRPEIFTVAFILSTNPDYITFLEITPETTFDGICMYPTERISSIKTDTEYTKSLSIEAETSSLLKHAQELASSIKDYTFDGLLASVKVTKTLIELMTIDDQTIAGQVVDFDQEVIKINEFVEKSGQQAAIAFIYRANLIRLSVEVPWLREIKKLQK